MLESGRGLRDIAVVKLLMDISRVCLSDMNAESSIEEDDIVVLRDINTRSILTILLS